MNSKWSHVKDDVIAARKKGRSLRDLKKQFGVPSSTLSGWLRTVELTPLQRARLRKRWEKGLVEARVKAVVWHNREKTKRYAEAERLADQTLSRIHSNKNEMTELALAFLYLGEGAKGDNTSLGNSDPMILRFFVKTLQRVYGVTMQEIKCDLHLRADQDPNMLKTYWSKTLKIPEENFCKPSIDSRTSGSPTYPEYKGVCVVRCGRVEIKRKLMYIATKFCDKASA